jgi:Putative cyclase
MPRTGTSAYYGSLDHRASSQADDLVDMPLQSGTPWDGLGHVFSGEHMRSGYSCREVSSADAQKRDVEKAKARMVAHGVLLDAPAFLGGDCLDDGYAIVSSDLDQTGESQGIGVRRGDCVTVRTAGSATNLLAIK